MKYSFKIERNIFMYNHRITCIYGEKKYQSICESAPTKEETILFWPDDFGVCFEEKETMINDLKQWLATQEFKYIIYDGKGR